MTDIRIKIGIEWIWIWKMLELTEQTVQTVFIEPSFFEILDECYCFQTSIFNDCDCNFASNRSNEFDFPIIPAFSFCFPLFVPPVVILQKNEMMYIFFFVLFSDFTTFCTKCAQFSKYFAERRKFRFGTVRDSFIQCCDFCLYINEKDDFSDGRSDCEFIFKQENEVDYIHILRQEVSEIQELLRESGGSGCEDVRTFIPSISTGLITICQEVEMNPPDKYKG
jgi:hypothetical protein